MAVPCKLVLFNFFYNWFLNKNHLVASSWHFTLFHEEDAQSNNPQVVGY